MSYTYSKLTASNGVILHTMKGSPNDIKLHSKSQLMSLKGLLDSGWLYGINGGFFDSPSSILSISIKDGKPLGTNNGYNGSSNAAYARGTIIWDASAKKFYCKQISTKSEIDKIVKDTTKYWAQGGISLALGKTESAWKTMIGSNGERIPGATKTYRAGMVYNKYNNIGLIVTDNECTIEQFRTAIKEKVGSGTLVDGISLDGSTCAQMYCAEATITRQRSIMTVIGFKRS